MNKFPDKLNALLKYFKYLGKSKHRKGHGIHSPCVYELVSNVLYSKTFEDNEVAQIKLVAASMLKSGKYIPFTEYGAGSNKMCEGMRKIGDLVKFASINEKFGKLLFRITSYYKPNVVIELGTSVGISTMYLLSGMKGNGQLVSVEGNKNLADIARRNLEILGLNNYQVLSGTFEEALSGDLLRKIKSPCIVFIDGNHTYNATVKYFEQFLPFVRKGMVIIGDIYWSIGMEMAWKHIQKTNPVTIDLYYMGIVIIDDLLTPGQYTVRF